MNDKVFVNKNRLLFLLCCSSYVLYTMEDEMKLYILNPKSTYKNPIGILRKSKKSVVNIGFLNSLLVLKLIRS